MATSLNKYSFRCIRMPPLFVSKQTFARIDFLRQGERLVDEKGTYYVKFLTKNQTKQAHCKPARVGNGKEDTCACGGQRERLQGMLLTYNGNNIVKTRRNRPSTSGFLLVKAA